MKQLSVAVFAFAGVLGLSAFGTDAQARASTPTPPQVGAAAQQKAAPPRTAAPAVTQAPLPPD